MVELNFSKEEAQALAAALPGTALAADCELAIAGRLPLARCAALQGAVEALRKTKAPPGAEESP